MEIKLNKAYASNWDNIEYPILELSDGSYLCICYEYSHKVYSVNTYTVEEFIEQGFKECNSYDDIFECMTRKMFG